MHNFTTKGRGEREAINCPKKCQGLFLKSYEIHTFILAGARIDIVNLIAQSCDYRHICQCTCALCVHDQEV